MKKTTFLILAIIFAVNTASAEVSVNSNKLSFDLGGAVSGFVKSTKEAVENVFEDKPEVVNEKVLPDEEEKYTDLILEKKDVQEMFLCEVYDATFLNAIILDTASTKAYEKIVKIEDTIEEEAQLRDGIFEKNKKLTDLQNKEKIIFREMKRELEDAKKFYKNIDESVSDTTQTLVTIDCEDIDTKKEKILLNSYQEIDELVVDEGEFRKTFTASLKEKIIILQTGVKAAGK